MCYAGLKILFCSFVPICVSRKQSVFFELQEAFVKKTEEPENFF